MLTSRCITRCLLQSSTHHFASEKGARYRSCDLETVKHANVNWTMWWYSGNSTHCPAAKSSELLHLPMGLGGTNSDALITR